MQQATRLRCAERPPTMPDDMRIPTTHARSHAGTHARPREAALSIVEMVVVLLIVAILIAIAVGMFGGAKSSARGNETKTVGSAYAQAISQYQADHANKNPTSSEMASVDGTSAGPTNLLDRPYISTLPESAGVRVGVDMSGGCAAPGGGAFTGWVSYCPEGAGPNFGVRVNTRATVNDPWSGECWIGSTAKTPRC
jgi:type II secretory pathway pseudopilin PulG